MKNFFNAICLLLLLVGFAFGVGYGVQIAVGFLNSSHLKEVLKGFSILAFVFLSGIVVCVCILRSVTRK